MGALSWLRPELLWGLLAASLPVIIHLIGKRKRRTIKFATLRFLERAKARSSTRYNLRQLLLLLARIMAIILLVSLFAGPGMESEGGAGSRRLALVVDTSMSMQLANGISGGLTMAKEELSHLVRKGSAADRYAVVVTGMGDGKPERMVDPAVALERIRGLAAGDGDTGIVRALEKAAALLTAEGGGEIIVTTDMQRHGWREVESLQKMTVSVQLVDVGVAGMSNLWVESVGPDAGGGVSVEVSIGSSGPAPKERTVRLRLSDGRELNAFVEGDVARFEPGPAPGGGVGVLQASVEPGGVLAWDDRLSFVSSQTGPVEVLLVNGDPRGFIIMDELLFIERALSSGPKLQDKFKVRSIRQSELNGTVIEKADLIWLANPATITANVAELLLQRVSEGAGVVVSAGEGWSEERQGDALELVSASPLRDRMLLRAGDPSRPPFELLDLDTLTGPLKGLADQSVDIGRVKVRGYWLADVGVNDSKVWARLANQAPLVVERRHGKGRLLLLATTVDRDWSDLCLSPAFLPFLERLLIHGAGRSMAEIEDYIDAGKVVVSPFTETVELSMPSGRRFKWEVLAKAVLEGAGVYLVKGSAGPVGGFVVRHDREESDLTRIGVGEVERIAEKSGLTLERDLPRSVTAREDMSAYFAALLLLMLVAEALLSARWLRKGPPMLFDDEEIGGTLR